MPKAKEDAAPEVDQLAELSATVTNLTTELEAAKARVEHLEGELRLMTANRDGLVAERGAMWRDYSRLRAVLAQAFPEIPDPEAKQAVKNALDAGQSH